jgi:dTDP-4-amino-4,6-dideoxygalactose transaminase
MYKGKLVGIMGDCGIFSFTENKNITTGEGGMLITNDEAIAEVARQVRNHGEMIDTAMNVRTYNSTMLGWNYRMTEMEAALGIAQFHKMDQLNAVRIELCNYLSRGLCGVDGLRTPVLGAGNKHVYYFYPLKYDEPKMGLQRELFVKALNAEGIPFGAGYVAPLYLTSIYHDRKPFAYQHYKGKARYDKGLCPVSERMHERELILTAVARPPATTSDMDDVLNAVYKIIENRTELMGRMAVGVAQ